MFVQKVKSEIEKATDDIMKTNRLVLSAKSGVLTREQVVRYLRNVLFIIRYTPIHLSKARQTAYVNGSNEIAEFMEQKFKEEVGHDDWAVSDIGSMGYNLNESADDITEGIRELVQYLDKLVSDNPLLYIAYMTFAEYFTVLAAPAFLESVEKCGIPRSSMTVIANHGELDRVHVQDDLEVISKFVRSSVEEQAFVEVLRRTAEILNRHFNECAEAA